MLVLLGRAVAKQGLSPILQAGTGSRQLRVAAAIGLGWGAVATVSLIDLQFGHALYFSVVAVDYRAHIAIIDAIARTGVPPVNPSFFPGQPVELYYYYFWFMLGSLVDLLGGPVVGARGASFGTTIWSGLGLLSIVALYVQPTGVHDRVRSWTRSGVAIGLLLVSGVDVIPVVIESLASLTIGQGKFYADLEWWNEQITAWLGAMVWVPHHVAALVAGFTAILLLRNVQQARGRQEIVTLGVLAGVSFASAAGTSIWVTFTFAAFLAVWLFISFRRRWRGELTAAAVAGAVATVLAAPYLLDLRHADQLGGIPIAPTVRAFLPAHQLLGAIGWGNVGAEYFFDSLLLPLNYSLELGFFAVAAIVY